jgi:hypothetical protein
LLAAAAERELLLLSSTATVELLQFHWPCVSLAAAAELLAATAEQRLAGGSGRAAGVGPVNNNGDGVVGIGPVGSEDGGGVGISSAVGQNGYG